MCLCCLDTRSYSVLLVLWFTFALQACISFGTVTVDMLLKVLTSTDRTTFECVQSFHKSDDASVARSLNRDIFVTSFDCMRSVTLPFEISLAGKVCEVGDQMKTKAGAFMLAFAVQDESGHYVQCMAHGRHAESDLLKEKQEIIAYFGSAQERLEGTPGKIWFYSESHIVPREEECVFCETSEEIVLRGEQE